MSRKASSHFALAVLVIALAPAGLLAQSAAGSFTVEQIKSYPFPNELTAAQSGSRIAWALNERGLRNIWVAEGPGFVARRLTNMALAKNSDLFAAGVDIHGDDDRKVRIIGKPDHGRYSAGAATVR